MLLVYFCRSQISSLPDCLSMCTSNARTPRHRLYNVHHPYVLVSSGYNNIHCYPAQSKSTSPGLLWQPVVEEIVDVREKTAAVAHTSRTPNVPTVPPPPLPPPPTLAQTSMYSGLAPPSSAHPRHAPLRSSRQDTRESQSHGGNGSASHHRIPAFEVDDLFS